MRTCCFFQVHKIVRRCLSTTETFTLSTSPCGKTYPGSNLPPPRFHLHLRDAYTGPDRILFFRNSLPNRELTFPGLDFFFQLCREVPTLSFPVTFRGHVCTSCLCLHTKLLSHTFVSLRVCGRGCCFIRRNASLLGGVGAQSEVRVWLWEPTSWKPAQVRKKGGGRPQNTATFSQIAISKLKIVYKETEG